MKVVQCPTDELSLTNCAVTHPDDIDAEKYRLVYELLWILQLTNILFIEFNKVHALQWSKSGKVKSINRCLSYLLNDRVFCMLKLVQLYISFCDVTLTSSS